MLRQDVAFPIVNFDDVRHVPRVDVYRLTRQCWHCRSPAVVGVEEVPDVGVDRSVVDVDAETRFQRELLSALGCLMVLLRIVLAWTRQDVKVLFVRDQARRQDTYFLIRTYLYRGCPLFVVKEVV